MDELAMILLTLPIFNSFGRMIETQADDYSLRTENRPDALSTALVKTAEYRYPRPGKVVGWLRRQAGSGPRIKSGATQNLSSLCSLMF